MVVAASGILLPAAQVQDRGDRRADTTAPPIKVHDIGLQLHKNDAGEIGFEVMVGGGLGRTPMIGQTIRDFLPEHELLAYLEAILRVYNLYGRRDNKYKARIKILVHEIGAEKFTRRGRGRMCAACRDGSTRCAEERELARIAAYFAPPPFEKLPRWSRRPSRRRSSRSGLRALGRRNNLAAHQAAGLCHRQHLAEARSAAFRATRPPSRWT